MDIVHAKVTVIDCFSKSVTIKTVTVSQPTFEKMKLGIGSNFSYFDNHIKYDMKVINVEQA